MMNLENVYEYISLVAFYHVDFILSSFSKESIYQKQLEEFRAENARLTNETQSLQSEVDRLQSIEKSVEDTSEELNALRDHVRLVFSPLQIFLKKIIFTLCL